MEEFETVMLTRDSVKGLHNFRENSQPPPSSSSVKMKLRKHRYCKVLLIVALIYETFLKNMHESRVSQPCLHALINTCPHMLIG